jgi:hypothetical protein
LDEVCGFRCGIITSVRIPLPHFFAWTLELERELELFLKMSKTPLSKNYNARIYNTNPLQIVDPLFPSLTEGFWNFYLSL